MRERKLIRLMNQELDGANSPGDSRALKACLEAQEGARRRYAELRSAMELLRSEEGPAPGPDFKDRVLAGIRRKPEPPAAKAGWTWGAALRPLRLKYALFFFLGLSLGLLLLFLFKNRAGEADYKVRQLVGTVLESKNARTVDSIRLDREGLSEELVIRAGDGLLAADIRGTTAKDLEVVLTFDPKALSLEALQRTAGDNGGLTIGPGRIAIRAVGPHGFSAIFTVQTALPVSLGRQVLWGGVLLQEKTVVVASEVGR